MNALLSIEVVVSILDRNCFSYFNFEHNHISIRFGIMYMILLETIVIWLTATVLCPIWLSTNSNIVWIIFNMTLYNTLKS
jgi:hypothetical protein